MDGGQGEGAGDAAAGAPKGEVGTTPEGQILDTQKATGGDGKGEDFAAVELANEAPVEKKGIFDRCAQALVPAAAAGALKRAARATGGSEDWESKEPQDRERWWELQLSIRSFENVTVNTVTCFFCVSVLAEDPKKHRSQVQLPVRYTPITTLTKNELFTPANPIIMYERKNFALTYRELEKHVVKVDMWKVSCWTFNEYHGYKKETLAAISNKDPNLDLMMKKKLSKAQIAKQKRNAKQQVGDVALFRCKVSMEEIFDFRLACDNWMLEISPEATVEPKYKKERKRLTFLMPKDRRSLPGQRTFVGGTSTYVSEWNRDKKKWFWARCGEFVFRGTRTHLQNTFFVVQVQSGDPPGAMLELNDSVQKNTPLIGKEFGKCLMNLTSVLDISVFKGQVKTFSKIREKYVVGELSGNVKCILCSKGMSKPETDYRASRPEQPKSSTTVGHLKPAERHLVVKVRKCENLPVADFDQGSSDPYLRVSWDNMVMSSAVIQCTTRPVFNQNFYFPVRMPYAKVGQPGSEKKYVENILKYELESKGQIQIEVWDDDVTSADYLGGCVLTIQELLSLRTMEERNLLGAIKKAKVDPDAGDIDPEEDKPAIEAWYEKPKKARVYNGEKTPLHQSSLPNNSTALLHFEAYFYPDWPENLKLDEAPAEKDTDEQWKQRKKTWDHNNSEFHKEYQMPFPDSIGAKQPNEGFSYNKNETLRRFTILANHPQRGIGITPLMSFVSPIIIPQEYSTPAKLLHWVHCLSYELTTRQERNGLVPKDGWKDPGFVMARRKGAAQDHAILLCSLLLGSKKDAYVCKGMVYAQAPEDDAKGGVAAEQKREESLIEHVWVMTREDGWVTFWEPCSRQVFHLPDRCKKPRARVSKKSKKGRRKGMASDSDAIEDAADNDAGDGEEDSSDDQEDTLAVEHPWDGEVADAKIGLEDMENLPTVGRQPKPKMRVQGKKKEREGREALRKKLIAKRESLDIAPDKEMLKAKTLVTWLPYDSIDIVFNNKQLWANRQNHNPACITYDLPVDLEDDAADTKHWKWEPLMRPGEEKTNVFSAISPSVSIQPPLRPIVVDKITKDLKEEMVQNLLLYRGKKGYDTYFDNSDELTNRLKDFLEIQELWLEIDPDSPDALEVMEDKTLDSSIPDDTLSAKDQGRRFLRDTLELRQWNKYGSPFFTDSDAHRKYIDSQEKSWDDLEKKAEDFRKKLDNFPAKRGKKFRGFPVHFSTSEQESIRNYLMELPLYKEFIDKQKEDLYYTIECKVYPLLGGVLSVWLYIGIQETIEEKKDGDGADLAESPNLSGH